MGAYADPFDPNKLLWNGCPCGRHRSLIEHQMAMSAENEGGSSRLYCEAVGEETPAPMPAPQIRYADGAALPDRGECYDPDCVDPNCSSMDPARAPAPIGLANDEPTGEDMEAALERSIESAVMKGIFGNDMSRRGFLKLVGSSTAAAAISSIFPMEAAKAVAMEAKGDRLRVRVVARAAVGAVGAKGACGRL